MADKAVRTNKILAEMKEDLKKMLLLEGTLREYRMYATTNSLDKDTGVLLKFIQNLEWALKGDELYEGGERGE